MTDKIIRQNAGFIASESQRAHADLERAKQFQVEGNERQAKAFQTRAETRMQRVTKAAATIMGRTNK